MGLTRLLVRDAAGKHLGLEITTDEFVVYLSGGQTLRYSYSGQLLYGEPNPVVITILGKDLEGIEIGSDALYYELENWGDALFYDLEKPGGALSFNLEKPGDALSYNLENAGDALFCNLTLGPDALFCALLKLLILKLYAQKQNTCKEKPPAPIKLSEDIDPLERLGERAGYYIQWTEEQPGLEWDFEKVAAGLGITDTKSLKAAHVSVEALVATALEVYATPLEKFRSGRIPVLVAKLRKTPQAASGPYIRLAEQGPEFLQHYLRTAITSWSSAVNDADWKAALGNARREDLIDLVEKLALGRILRAPAGVP
jgi:hypothetical protein